MSLEIAENSVIRYTSFGVPLTSAFVWASGTTDPVNVTKLFVMGGVAGATGLLTFLYFGNRIWRNHKLFIFLCLAFQVSMLNALINGEGPFLQSFYGAYGRQTGFVTYFFLNLVLVSVMVIRKIRIQVNLISGILAVGVLNVLYCAWVLAFGDFLPWNNVYRSILGLFGNPDFISAYLGILIVVCFSIFFRAGLNLKLRTGLVLLATVAFFEILKSHAIQGIVVTVGGIVLVGFYLLRSICKSWLLPTLYAAASGVVGILAVMGTLQTGPLSFVYKRSVSLRGSYWHAGLGMGAQHPLTGVGLDGYGDFYRQARPPVALIDMPGVQVVSNVSHNVFIDFFASGGWPLLITYSLVNLYIGFIIAKHTMKHKKYDYIFVSLSTAWICYTVQSVISINQIGLAVWGWVLAGGIIGYSKYFIDQEERSIKEPAKSRQKNVGKYPRGTFFTPQLVAGIGVVLGLFLAFPPLGSDMKWKSALDSRSLEKLEVSLQSSFFNPVPSSRYSAAYQIFGNSNMPDKALKYMRISIKENPNYFEGWKAIYLMPSSTREEKHMAEMNLKRLDPLNPDVTKP